MTQETNVKRGWNAPVGHDSNAVFRSLDAVYSPEVPEVPDWLSGLNPQQLQAVTHGDGPLLLIAAAPQSGSSHCDRYCGCSVGTMAGARR